MKRLTTDTPKNNLQAALNLFYIKDHETWVRGGGPGPEYADVNLFDFIRDVVKKHIPDVELPEDNDDLSDMMPEWLMDGIDSAEGVVALLYTAAWAYAELRHKLMNHEDFMERWNLRSVEEADRIFQRINDLGGTDLMAQYRELGPIDHLRELIRAEQGETLKVCSSCYYGDNRACPDGMDILMCGTECVGCVCGECEGGSKFKLKAALIGKGRAAPDAPEEPAEPEWKGRVMRTFLGGRRSE